MILRKTFWGDGYDAPSLENRRGRRLRIQLEGCMYITVNGAKFVSQQSPSIHRRFTARGARALHRDWTEASV